MSDGKVCWRNMWQQAANRNWPSFVCCHKFCLRPCHSHDSLLQELPWRWAWHWRPLEPVSIRSRNKVCQNPDFIKAINGSFFKIVFWGLGTMPNRKRRISRISLARDARRLPLNNAPTLWVPWGKYIQRFKARTQEHQKNQIKNQFKCSESQDQPLKKFLAFFNIPKFPKSPLSRSCQVPALRRLREVRRVRSVLSEFAQGFANGCAG